MSGRVDLWGVRGVGSGGVDRSGEGLFEKGRRIHGLKRLGFFVCLDELPHDARTSLRFGAM